MGKFRFRSYLDDGLFVLVIMAAAAASAALEAGAVLGALSGSSLSAFANAEGADRKAAAASAPVRVAASASEPAFASRVVARLAR